MVKVYVVSRTERISYELLDNEILGIFSTLDIANEYKNKHESEYWTRPRLSNVEVEYYVTEYEIDKGEPYPSAVELPPA